MRKILLMVFTLSLVSCESSVPSTAGPALGDSQDGNFKVNLVYVGAVDGLDNSFVQVEIQGQSHE